MSLAGCSVIHPLVLLLAAFGLISFSIIIETEVYEGMRMPML